MLHESLEKLNKTDKKWTLDDDSKLCTLLDTLNNTMQNQLEVATKTIESLDRDSTEASIMVSHLNNRLDFYASKKFIESRVHDDNTNDSFPVCTAARKSELERQEEAVQSVKEVLIAGFRMIEDKFKRIDTNVRCNDNSTAVEDDDSFCTESVFEPYDPHLARQLPLIIGTSEWISSPSAGLCEKFNEVEKKKANDVVVGIPSVESKKDESSSESTSKVKTKGDQSEGGQKPGKIKLDAAFAAKIGAGPAVESEEKCHFMDNCSQGVDSLFTDSESDDDLFNGPTTALEIKNHTLLDDVVVSKPPLKVAQQTTTTSLEPQKSRDALNSTIRKNISSSKNLFSSDSSDDLEDNDNNVLAERKKPIALPRSQSQNPEFKNMLAGVITVKPKPKPKPQAAAADELTEQVEKEPEAEETKAETGFHLTKTRMKRPGKRLPKRYQAKYEEAVAQEEERKKRMQVFEDSVISELMNYILSRVVSAEDKQGGKKRKGKHSETVRSRVMNDAFKPVEVVVEEKVRDIINWVVEVEKGFVKGGVKGSDACLANKKGENYDLERKLYWVKKTSFQFEIENYESFGDLLKHKKRLVASSDFEKLGSFFEEKNAKAKDFNKLFSKITQESKIQNCGLKCRKKYDLILNNKSLQPTSDKHSSPTEHASDVKPDNLLFPDSEDEDVFQNVPSGLPAINKSSTTDRTTDKSRQTSKFLFESDSEDDLFKETVEEQMKFAKDSDNSTDINDNTGSSSKDASFHDIRNSVLKSEEDSLGGSPEPSPRTPFFEAE
uniref:WASH complex subunit FAM21 n=1 Tax=Syphacia muris TaxID=451379 RepID=A0A0N5AXA7_9BILA